MIPVFGGERFLRPSCGAAQEVSASNFKIFWPSTNCPQFGGSYPPVSPDSPQEIHRWSPDGAGFSLSRLTASTRSAMRKEIGRRGRRSAGPRVPARPGARRSAGQAGDSPAARARARPSGRGQPIWHEISRTARRGPAGRKEAGRSSRRSAGPHGPARPGARRSAGQAGDQPGRRGHPIWQEISRAHVGRAVWGGTGRSRTVGRTARGDAARGNPGRTKEEAPPRMRWRGPSDPAAPDTAISCSASVPLDQPPSQIPA